ncbi:UNVERIFIED_CONTAM: putative inactive receptor kinase [Sesamum radiatum]|uniref:Inactive receptor kinase n=1 Tax=Sesamum radiatum TaxID=300843 RepID=A0AAW2WNG6_SESRA
MGKKKLSGGAIAGIVIGSVVGFFLLLLLLIIFCRRKSGQKGRSVDAEEIKNQEDETGEKPIMEAENGSTDNRISVAAAAAAAMSTNGNAASEDGGKVAAAKKLVFFWDVTRVFDLEDLLSASEVLGKGSFGTSYKAVLEVGTVVTVKRLKDVMISEWEFKEKLKGLGPWIMRIWCLLELTTIAGKRSFLYMIICRWEACLHFYMVRNRGAGGTPLNWEIRSRIALGAARGIEYLHCQGSNTAHGNIKSSNVLLTKSYDARISDFGLNQLVGPPSSPTRVTGYRAPEVTDPRKVSQKADVYSFGVLLLELLTGKAPLEDGLDLPRWVESVVREEWTSEVFDRTPPSSECRGGNGAALATRDRLHSAIPRPAPFNLPSCKTD